MRALRWLERAFRGPAGGGAPIEEPIRAELFGVERLEAHAASLAEAQVVTSHGRRRRLTPRVEDNGRRLLACYREIARAVAEERAITPAAEWLLDNFHVVEDQIREIREDLPPGYYAALPKLAAGPLAGYPRVYGIAWAFVAHLDSRFDPEALRRFVVAYQRVAPLTIGELWAIAITIRIALVENLRRLAERLVVARAARGRADELADELLGLEEAPPAAAAALLARIELGPLPRAFLVELVQRLRDRDPSVTPGLPWLDERLKAEGTTAENLVLAEHQAQASASVTVRNVITSMRQMSAFDWPELVESVSLVDEMLRASSGFGAMDFATRDHYRHAIEDLARGAHVTELVVARRALDLARPPPAREPTRPEPSSREPPAHGPPTVDGAASERLSDPGYYLLARGRPVLERSLGFRAGFRRRLLRAYVDLATPGYLLTITSLSAALAFIPVSYLLLADAPAPALALARWLFALAALLPASDLAIALVNRSVTALVGPRLLPKLELEEGVPESLRTLVVVPTLLTDLADVEQQLERLEVLFLANDEGDLRFALLSDWVDARAATLLAEGPLLAAARERVASLNARYGPVPGGGARFLLLHRRRLWNEAEGRFMGWERKRGKLHELNRLLRGATDTSFLPADPASAEAGLASAALPSEVPSGVRYVITLDADTRLPRGAARRLVATMAHPLNHPRFDQGVGRVVEGYGVLQPRVTPSLPAEREGSFYQRVFSGPSGIDPYAAAVSDVYQDLFGEGSYTGKGIYDVDAFEQALAGLVPDNAVLSHDLFEGTFARAGLVTDVEVLEEFPSHYLVAAARQHRWARGDWQLLPWILGRATVATGSARPPPRVPWIARWKMLDNLRRSLSAPGTFVFLLTGLLLPRPLPLVAAAFVLAALSLPSIVHVLTAIVPRHRGSSKRSLVATLLGDLELAAAQAVLGLAFLAHQTHLMADAIARTLWRLLVSRRHLLEWVTAAQARSAHAATGTGYRRMAGAIGLAALAGAITARGGPEAWIAGGPLVLLWLLSPLLAERVSTPPRSALPPPLAPEARHLLRVTARRTWRYFETFVGEVTNALPPDNFQEDPKPVVAPRTSPTNIGLYLLSTVAARDFGWSGSLATRERLEATLATVGRLEKFRGHLLNWYDVHDLRPLEPRYISSVDSGNLAGHLLALGQACREVGERPILGPEALRGIEDALLVVRELARGVAWEHGAEAVGAGDLEEAMEAVAAVLGTAPGTPSAWAAKLDEIRARADTLADIAMTLSLASPGVREAADLFAWTESLRRSAASWARDLDELAPWARLDPTRAGDLAATPLYAALRATVPSPAGVLRAAPGAILELRAHRMALGARGPETADAVMESEALAQALARSHDACERLVGAFARIERTAVEMARAMEFGFLLDPVRKLFSIGCRVAAGELDPGTYDLLASEARLTSFVAIAKGDVEASHWFHLGRSLTPVDRGSALVSWSGSMFEYLMPLLVLRAPRGSLLEQTGRLVVRRQIAYGSERGVPWGVSESAYAGRDLELTYQYSAFGVPGLGLKRGLGEEVVVAPYATLLAAMVDPAGAAYNLERLRSLGASGEYGYYDAVDYTPERLPAGSDFTLVRTYMAHHQGMSIVALANVLEDGRWRDRFHADPDVQAAELLLQERTPRGVAVARPRVEEVKGDVHRRNLVAPVERVFQTPHGVRPKTHLLSNGRYTVMLTAAGSGRSSWRDLDVTRWREDPTRDDWGTWLFLRDVESGEVWSAGYQPSGVEPDAYAAVFTEDKAEIRSTVGSIEMSLEVVVSPEDDAEVRRLTVVNQGTRVRTIEVTSYAEVVLAPAAADAAHPAFSKLFVETEYLPGSETLLASRRPRSPGEPRIYLAHVVAVEGEAAGASAHRAQFETDRSRFLGRGRGIRNAAAVREGRPLSGTEGATLDPVVSLRRRLRIAPGARARVSFSTLVGTSRDEAVNLADKYRDAGTFERTATLAWTQAQVQLQHLGVSSDEARLFQRLASRLIYSDPSLRAVPEILKRSLGGRTALWAHGISGDLPIALVRIDDVEDQATVRQLLQAHEYWRMKRLAVNLVLLNERPSSYTQDLQATLQTLVRTSHSPAREGEARGSVFLLRHDLLPRDDLDVLRKVARAIIVARTGSLADQIVRTPRAEGAPYAPASAFRRVPAPEPAVPLPPRIELELWNGIGGFARGGREYVIVIGEGRVTPAPWINVVANPSFGFQVSESGSGFTWCGNSRENRLTPWSNDPVSDPPGEVLYVRDEETGELWGPTALPIREASGRYVARHGQGWSRFEREAHGIALDLVQFVPRRDPVKISRLGIENRSGRPRRLSVTSYVEWVLGVDRAAAAPFTVTEIDPATKALLARNSWNEDFPRRVAFTDLWARVPGQIARLGRTSHTGDRAELIGRNGTLERPAALARPEPLSGRVGAGLDPCGALQIVIELPPGGRVEVDVMLGQAESREEAQALIERTRAADLDAALEEVVTGWDDVLGALEVRTPDRAMDLLLNRWLLYQSLACRVWARSAFYQSGGAYGFRDQVQDVMALAVASPSVARTHLLRAASRQFVEGDVQHWWHPPSGRGVRTRISDNRVWLPHAVAHYIRVTGDDAILDEQVPFLEGPALAPTETDLYGEPRVSGRTATLYEHLALALERSLASGPHGLPLIGAGDWNDGMNRVGPEGKGESVWLAWFLSTVLEELAPIAAVRGETARATAWLKHVVALKDAAEHHGWDGDWYRRAYFDDGTPLGTASASECRIDSIAQSWAVLSGAAEPARAARALASAEEHLVRRKDGLVLLLTPPFDRGPLEPGYIKGYLPGVRENGGQYTHAAAWMVIAEALLGDGDKAASLFSLLNPINHTSTRTGVHRYKVEPYVVAADVYSEPPHVGRGGWTWYTGSASWMYRAGVEWILGFRLRDRTLHVEPCIPRAWRAFELTFRYHASRYEIAVENPDGVSRGVASIELDGKALARGATGEVLGIPLSPTEAVHRVRVVMGSTAQSLDPRVDQTR